MSNKQIEEVPINGALLNSITPIGMEFKQNTITVGESSGRVYGIVKYPQTVDYGWLSRLTNIPSTIASITFTPVDDSAFLESIDTEIVQENNEIDEFINTELESETSNLSNSSETEFEEADIYVVQIEQPNIEIDATIHSCFMIKTNED